MLHDILFKPQQESCLAGIVQSQEDNLGIFVHEPEVLEGGLEPVYYATEHVLKIYKCDVSSFHKNIQPAITSTKYPIVSINDCPIDLHAVEDAKLIRINKKYNDN